MKSKTWPLSVIILIAPFWFIFVLPPCCCLFIIFSLAGEKQLANRVFDFALAIE